MLANHTSYPQERTFDLTRQQLVMRTLQLVTDIMVDDVPLAEQIRMAILTIWLASKRTEDPSIAWVAWRDIQRGEMQLRNTLYLAFKHGYLDRDGFDEVMGMLSRLSMERLRQHAADEMSTLD